MCMSEVKMTMTRGKNGEYYGVGYKRIPPDYSKGGFAKRFEGPKPRIGRWVEDNNKEMIGRYASGFHLFITYEDAVNYNGGSGDIYECYFKDVVAVGTELVTSKVYPVAQEHKTCVIVRKMKVIKKV